MNYSLDNLRYLIVNADDFGYTEGVSRGIIEAHRMGIVTSTSVMVTMPDAERAIEQALEEAPRLGMGVHLSLTAGEALTEPSLIMGRPTLRKQVDSLPLNAVEAEFRAQIERFGTLAGRPPDHLDSHHHVTYMTSDLFNLMVGLADELGVPVRRGYPPSEVDALRLFASVRGLADEGEAAQLFAVYEAERRDDALTTANINLDYYGKHTTLGDLLLHLVDTPPGTTELMCHPGHVDAALEEASSYVGYRKQELHALTQRSARELLTTEGIVLIAFGQLEGVREHG